MFMWLVEPCLEFIHHHCKAIVQTSSIHLTYSLMKLYTCLIGKYPKPHSFYFSFSLFPVPRNKMQIIRCKEIPKEYLYCLRPYDTNLFLWICVLIIVLWLPYRAFTLGHWCYYKTEHDFWVYSMCFVCSLLAFEEKKTTATKKDNLLMLLIYFYL